MVHISLKQKKAENCLICGCQKAILMLTNAKTEGKTNNKLFQIPFLQYYICGIE